MLSNVENIAKNESVMMLAMESMSNRRFISVMTRVCVCVCMSLRCLLDVAWILSGCRKQKVLGSLVDRGVLSAAFDV